MCPGIFILVIQGQFNFVTYYNAMKKHENAFRFTLTNQNHSILSESWPLTPSGMIRVQLMIGGHGKVVWGHNPFITNNSRQDGDRDEQTVPNGLACQVALEGMHIELLRSWPDLDLTWDLILKLTFPGTCSEPASREYDNFSFDDVLSQNCWS